MPRQNRRRPDEPPGASSERGLPTGAQRTESWRGERYAVRTVAGASASKSYRCPGCDQEIRPGVAHVVAWPADDAEAADRRHWHTGCWGGRESRSPGVRRSRSAPRY